MTLRTPAQQAWEILADCTKKAGQFPHLSEEAIKVIGDRYVYQLDAITTALTTLQTQHEAEIDVLRSAVVECGKQKEYHRCDCLCALQAFDVCRKKQVKREDL